MATTKRDYYEVLGCVKTADGKTLKTAYRKLAMEFHPDRNPDKPEAEAKFKEINEAYSILSDEQKRAAYDRMGHSAFGQGGGGQAGGGFHDFSDIFSQIFGQQGGGGFGDMFGGGNQGGGRRTVRGADLRYEMEISLEESFAGKDLEINVPISEDCHGCDGSGAAEGAKVETCSTCGGLGKVRTQQGFFTMERPCPRCGGQGEYVSDPCRTCDGGGQVRVETALEVNIPAGVEDGTRIRLSGQGDSAPKSSGPRGSARGSKGDLYIFVSVAPHDLFEREGPHLFCETHVPMTCAALGGEVEIPSIDGGRTKVKIPAGSQSGRRMRLKAKGMSVLRSNQRGDMYVDLIVETPSGLNARQKQLMEEFRKEGGDDSSSPQSASFLDKAKSFWDNLVD